jgi:hypothetical protein
MTSTPYTPTERDVTVAVTPAFGPVPAIYVPRWPEQQTSVWLAVRHLAHHVAGRVKAGA